MSDSAWNEWSKYVLEELKRLNVVTKEFREECAKREKELSYDISDLSNRLYRFEIKLNDHKTRVTMYSGIAGFVISAIVSLIAARLSH